MGVPVWHWACHSELTAGKMYREIEGEDVILEKDPTYTLTEDGAIPFVTN